MPRPRAYLEVAHEVGSREFLRPLVRLGIPARIARLPYGDFVFPGHGPTGDCHVVVERKRVAEMVGHASRTRFVGRQLPGMLRRFQFQFLVVEGLTRVDKQYGSLDEGREIKNGRLVVWHEAGWGRERNTFEVYVKRELTLRLRGGVQVLRSANPGETAFVLHALYRWFQKPWNSHRSCYALDTQIQADPLITDERSWRRDVLAKFPFIGWKRSARVARYFPSLIDAVNADEDEWMRALGIAKGRKIAHQLVRVLNGKDSKRTAKGV